MKRSLLAALGSVVLFASCKEKAPNIDFAPPAMADTVYNLSTIPAAEPHNVMVEEYTGQSCSNCPAGHEQLEALAAANPNRVNIVCLYQKDNTSLTNPPEGYVYDFRTDAAIDIANYVSGALLGTIPNAFIDRAKINSNIIVSRADWSTAINTQLPKTDSVNLDITNTYNSSDSMVKTVVTVTYTQNVSTKQKLNVLIVEDDIVDKQEKPFGVIDEHYEFKNVFRQMVSSAEGDFMLLEMPVKPAGTMLRRTYNYKLAGWNPRIIPSKCRVIAYVSSEDMHVMQSRQAKLVP
jgi:hypothetical protein